MRTAEVISVAGLLATLAAAVPDPNLDRRERNAALQPRQILKQKREELALLQSQSHKGFGSVGEKLHDSFKATASSSHPIGEKTKVGEKEAARHGPKSSILSEAASKATLEEAIRVQFAFSKGQPKLPMLFPSLAALRTPTLARAQSLGLLHPSALSKLPKAAILAKLATVAPAEHHHTAAMTGAGARDPHHYERAALELYLDKARPDLHLGPESLAAARQLATWHENLLLHRPNRVQFRPYMFVHEPGAGPAALRAGSLPVARGEGGGGEQPRRFGSLR